MDAEGRGRYNREISNMNRPKTSEEAGRDPKTLRFLGCTVGTAILVDPSVTQVDDALVGRMTRLLNALAPEQADIHRRFNWNPNRARLGWLVRDWLDLPEPSGVDRQVSDMGRITLGGMIVTFDPDQPADLVWFGWGRRTTGYIGLGEKSEPRRIPALSELIGGRDG